MNKAELNFKQAQDAVWNNRTVLKGLGATIPNKAQFYALPESTIQELYAQIPATDNSSIDDKEVADVTGVTKHSSKAGEAYYTTPCKFIEMDGTNAMFEILHGTNAGRRLCISEDKDLVLINRTSPIPSGTIMNFGYTHGMEPFKFLGNIVTANSVCFPNSDADNRSLGRLIKALSPEIFQAVLDSATELKKATRLIQMEEALLNNVNVRQLRAEQNAESMQDALKSSKQRVKDLRAKMLGR